MSQVEPMTAAEWLVRIGGNPTIQTNRRIHAALEERERLLGEREAMVAGGWYQDRAQCFWCKAVLEKDQAPAHVLQCDKRPDHSDAVLGALVRRIGEARGGCGIFVSGAPFIVKVGTGISYPLTRDGLQSALDSLLPKEPEVVTGPSGKAYRVKDGVVEHLAIYPVNRNPASYSPPSAWERLEVVTLCDAPVVAKLMAGGGK